MHRTDTDLTFSATDLSGFLACAHLTTQDLAAVRGGPKPPKFEDPGAEVLRQRGHEHEAAILTRYRCAGLQVAALEKPGWTEADGHRWSEYAAETRAQMEAGVDVIHQACLHDDPWLGLPDFLVKVERSSVLGPWSYEVVDAKLARSAKAGALLQISLYSEMLGTVQGVVPEHMHLALGGLSADPDSGLGAAAGVGVESRRGDGIETFRVTDVAAYYRSVKRRFVESIEREAESYPEPCAHCTVCAWQPVCKKRWRTDDHLSLVAGITRRQRADLERRGTETLEALAGLALDLEPPLESVGLSTYVRIREQARIQFEGRTEGRPKYELLTPVEEEQGLLALPTPSPGDLFFDIEGDPHAFGDGIEYLLGYTDTRGDFTGLWALDPHAEREAFETFIDRVMERLEAHPDLHIYHYAAYEQTAMKRLAARYGTREEEVDALLRGRVFVDLYRVVRGGLRASVESYSIKKLEPLYGFERDVELRAASSALANFEAWLQLGGGDGASALLEQIEGYNRDDCLSTRELRSWLEELRAELEGQLRAEGELEGDLPRPEAPDGEAPESVQEENERVQALVAELTGDVPDDPAERSAEQQARWILSHLLSWHRREKKSMWWEYFRLLDLDEEEMRGDAKAVAGLEYEGEVGTVKRSIVHRYRFPAQDFGIRRGDVPHDPRTGNSAGKVHALDLAAGTLDLKRGKTSEVPHPTALIPFDDVPDKILRARLCDLAEDVVARELEGAQHRAAVDLLLRAPPRVGQASGAPLRPDGESNLDAARRLALRLDRTVLPIQGPPGSGKTYIGARMIVSLMKAGKRVGVTATSHKVVVNLLDEVCRAADEEAFAFRGMQKAKAEAACRRVAIDHTNENAEVEELVAEDGVDLVAGTVWLWAREAMQQSVDVLVVDEAGQISLANVLAAAGAADSVVLLGDPQQLEQPQQGVHPPGTDRAALEHLVGGDTLEADRGLFLEETWRLHPDICAFTSELFYEGRLSSRRGLSRQIVSGAEPFDGAGLRFHPVEHTGNSNESPEEVEAVRLLVDALLRSEPMWVDAKGERRPVRLEDVLVVAPYNAHVSALREALPDGIPVGTVDKFQGQEAPIVLYSTATSSVEDAPRGMEFLFSPNRLNVATSRARCLVVLVGSPSLLGPECRSVRQMRLANGVCRFGEMAG